MLRPVIDPARGRLRVVGFCSGSGETLWRLFALQKEMEACPEGCPFEVAGVFADADDSAALRGAKERGLPAVSLDIRKYVAKK